MLAVNAFFQGRSTLSAGFDGIRSELCVVLDIPLYELFELEDKHSKLSEHELQLLSFYRSLDEHNKEDR